jgi:hypothetical protein
LRLAAPALPTGWQNCERLAPAPLIPLGRRGLRYLTLADRKTAPWSRWRGPWERRPSSCPKFLRGLGAVVSGRPGTSEKPSRPACASLNIVNYDVREPHSLGSTWRRQQKRTRSTRLTRTSNSSSDCPRREPPKSRVRSKETGICPDRTRLLVGRLNPRAGNRFCKNLTGGGRAKQARVQHDFAPGSVVLCLEIAVD